MEDWCSKKKEKKRGKLTSKEKKGTERRQDTAADFLSPRNRRSRRGLIPALSNQLASHMAGLYLDIVTALLPFSFSFFLCNFYLGQRLLSCHVSPAVCTVYPGCHHRAWRRRTSGRSWTREEKEVIHTVCGPLKRKRAE